MGQDPLSTLDLRDALNHLYDLDYLAKSPLAAQLTASEEGLARGGALLRLLQTGIQAMRPTDEGLSETQQTRFYEVLHHRYIERMTQAQTAKLLGLTDRHVRRQQKVALLALASYLEQNHGLVMTSPWDVDDEDDELSAQGDVDREMSWLADSFGQETCDVAQTIADSFEVADALAKERGLFLRVSNQEELARAAIPATVLKQVLLNLVSSAICLPGAKELRLLTRSLGPHIAIDFRGGQLRWVETELDISRQLLSTFGAQLVTLGHDEDLAPRILLDRADRVLILAVEDNLDTLKLWQRFLRNTRFQLVGLSDPQRTMERAMALKPDLVMLDVMMPGTDGWGLLRQLRRHPETTTIPVIICTVLPQEQLARSLGASGFIRKPIKGNAFRAQLERQIAAVTHR